MDCQQFCNHYILINVFVTQQYIYIFPNMKEHFFSEALSASLQSIIQFQI